MLAVAAPDQEPGYTGARVQAHRTPPHTQLSSHQVPHSQRKPPGDILSLRVLPVTVPASDCDSWAGTVCFKMMIAARAYAAPAIAIRLRTPHHAQAAC